MTETLSTFQLLDCDELFSIDGGSIQDVFIIGGKILLTVAAVATVVAGSAGSGGLGTALAVAGGIVAIATIWYL